jgi:hypothetical protein
MKKFFTKKIAAGLILILLAAGIFFGDTSRVKHYFDQAISYVNDFLETTE